MTSVINYIDEESEWHTLEFMKKYKLSPFKIKDKLLIIPEKYLEVLESLNTIIDFRNLEATRENWEFVRQLLVSGYWMDCWYQDNLPTPYTRFYELDKNASFMGPKFIRLNSVSPKNQTQPLYSLNYVDQMLENERCVNSMNLAKNVNRKIYITVRDWVDVKEGIEWRCFVFDDKIRAIGINDTVISDATDSEIIERVDHLYQKIRYNIPCIDCVMDVWLHDKDPKKDIVIEFNSYGFWGNAGIDLYDWVTDGAILYGLVDDIVVRR